MSADCPCCGDARPPVTWDRLSVSLTDGAFWQGRRIPVSTQRLAILHHLARRAPRTIARDALLLSSFSDEAGDDALAVQVCKLRRILRGAGVPIGIASTYGVGYRLERIGSA